MGEVIALIPRIDLEAAQVSTGAANLAGLGDLALAAGAENIPIPLIGRAEATVSQLPIHLDDEDLAIDVSNEIYGSSLRFKRRLGQLALAGELDTKEGREAWTADYDDWVSELGEKMKTAESLKGIIEVNRTKVHLIRDGHVLASDNKSHMDRLVEAGETSSRLASFQAESDLKRRVMATQAERDASDVFNVHRVDEIATGRLPINSRTVVSMFPQEAMERDGVEAWEDMNYTEGLAYIQSYYFDGEYMHQLTFSVNCTDKDQLREVLNGLGFGIPEDAHTNDWVRYGREVSCEPGEVIELLKNIRKESSAAIGKEVILYAVEDVLHYEEGILTDAFQELNIPLARSIASGVKDPKIEEFARQILAGGGILDGDLRKDLIRICNRESFDNRDGRVIDELVKYSVVEALRESAIDIAKKSGLWKEGSKVTNSGLAPRPVVEEIPIGANGGAASFAQRMGMRVIEGAEAGRSYGGCPGNRMRVTGKVSRAERQAMDPQDAFGGHDIEMEEDDEALNIPSLIRCIKCDEYSPKEEVVHSDYWCCPKCNYKIDICNGAELHESNVDTGGESEKTNKVISMEDFKKRYARQSP